VIVVGSESRNRPVIEGHELNKVLNAAENARRCNLQACGSRRNHRHHHRRID